MKKFILGNFNKVVNTIVKKIKNQKTLIILPCSIHDLAQSRNNSFYKDIDFCTTDSMWLTWWFRFNSNSTIERVYGPDLMTAILKKIEVEKLSCVFLGADTQSLSKIKKITLNKNQTSHYLLIKKSASSKKEQNVIDKIIEIQPDILWIGIGSPKQAELAVRLKTKLKNTTIFCVGAAFDFVTNSKKQAPKFIQQNGLEWLFRLVTEPRRLWKRYLVIIPFFLFSLIIKKLFKDQG